MTREEFTQEIIQIICEADEMADVKRTYPTHITTLITTMAKWMDGKERFRALTDFRQQIYGSAIS